MYRLSFLWLAARHSQTGLEFPPGSQYHRFTNKLFAAKFPTQQVCVTCSITCVTPSNPHCIIQVYITHWSVSQRQQTLLISFLYLLIAIALCDLSSFCLFIPGPCWNSDCRQIKDSYHRGSLFSNWSQNWQCADGIIYSYLYKSYIIFYF